MITSLVNNVANVTQTNLINSNQVKIIEAANLLDYFLLTYDLTDQVSSSVAGITKDLIGNAAVVAKIVSIVSASYFLFMS